jgi:hypothetical protein
VRSESETVRGKVSKPLFKGGLKWQASKNCRGRHEMFHELNRREVFKNVLAWIPGVLEGVS